MILAFSQQDASAQDSFESVADVCRPDEVVRLGLQYLGYAFGAGHQQSLRVYGAQVADEAVVRNGFHPF